MVGRRGIGTGVGAPQRNVPFAAEEDVVTGPGASTGEGQGLLLILTKD